LIGSKTAQDFVSLLPLTLTMNDLFGREKFARLRNTKDSGVKSGNLGNLPGQSVVIWTTA
jgi:hypothetical protein